jgi:hypothetical protein
MEREVFKNYYDETVRTIATRLSEQIGGIGFSDNCDGVYEEYLSQKHLLKLVGEKTQNDLIDRHKISACIAVAIMKSRLLYNKNTNDTDAKKFTFTDTSRMNERLAFLCGLENLVDYMGAKDDALKETLTTQGFVFPETNYPDRSRYFDSIVRAMYYSNVLSGFQTLYLANIYFLLEAYCKLHYSTVQLTKSP